MRLAVFSDIHGNLAALEAAIVDYEARGGADTVWVLGDLAAFGPRPAECIGRVVAWREAHGAEGFKLIGGNTDRYLVHGTRPRSAPAADADALRALAAQWATRDATLNWAAGRLSFDDYELLRGIIGAEVGLDAPGYGYVIGYHGVPGDDEINLTADTPDEQAADYLLDREGRLGIGGHIHRQLDRRAGAWRVLNVGSIGMSFDSRGRASWGLFSFEGGELTVELRTVAYDVDAVIADLEAVGHPAPGWFAGIIRP